MRYLAMITIAALILAGCGSGPSPTPTALPAPAKAQASPIPTPESISEIMAEMPCVRVMRYLDAIRLQREDVGLSGDTDADSSENMELWIEFAMLMSRLHDQTINWVVARERIEECR